MIRGLGVLNMDTAVSVEAGDAHRKRSSRPRYSWRQVAWHLLSPGVAVGAAAVLSLPRLGSRIMWLDEAYTVGATNELVDTWRETGGTQALYYLFVWPISRLSTDPAWMRLPSALVALVAVVAVYEVGRRIGGRVMGGLAAGGLALSWGLARYAVEARGYTLSLLLVSLSWLALVVMVQGGGSEVDRRWWRLFVVATMLAPLAHGLAVLHLVAQVAAVAVAPDGRGWLRRLMPVGVIVAVELGVLAAFGVSEIGNWVPPLNLGQLRGIQILMVGFGLGGIVLTALVAVSVADVLSSYWRDRGLQAWCRAVPAFWALGPPSLLVLISLFRPYGEARYVFAALPGFVLLIAHLVIQIRSVRGTAVASAAVAVLMLTSQSKVTTTGIEDWSGLTACMAANTVEGDRLATARSHRPAIDYYWSRQRHTAPLDPLAPPDPLGEVKRIYQPLEEGEEMRERLLKDTTTSIWYVDRGEIGRIYLAGFAFDPEIASRYVLSEPWYFRGDLTLIRFDPVSSVRPADAVPCDTVDPPPDVG